MNTISMKRVYENAEKSDGFRILVDRLWPRGISKERAEIDLWAKNITPATNIRKEFHHDPELFPAFRAEYLDELENNPAIPDFIQTIRKHLENGNVTFVYAAKDVTFNHVVVLRDFIQEKM
jgi:uncharacterized protein YeaO (DUF488 family)